ncbi:MAG: Rieske 2Fe-2S domain-containing protein [Dehalococcoidia bacterium]
MATTRRTAGQRLARQPTPYQQATLGFQEYWYPLCGSKEIGTKPTAFTMLGQAIAALRRNGKPYAVIDGCPHRGAPLSRARYEFPGTDTITCRFHGWTYDVTNGMCVAALPDGPDSPVVGKVRVQTFPLMERNGLVYIWMGKGEPVPADDDLPRLPLREGAVVRHRRRIVHGDWRNHAEFAGAGHFNVLHRDAPPMKLDRFFAYLPNPRAELTDEEGDGDGEYLVERNDPAVVQAEYPGLGSWPPLPFWRRMRRAKRLKPVSGVSTLTAIRLPGVMRVRNFPQLGSVYYEWYVPRDEEHYTYFQISTTFPGNPVSRLWDRFWFTLWGKPMFMDRFNRQDVEMVEAVRRWEEQRGKMTPAKLFGPDVFPQAWVDYCNQYARGVGWEYGA